jgi:hypothetical protein
MNHFTLGGWVSLSISLGARKLSMEHHVLFRAVFFDLEKDRDAFLELSGEEFPDEFFVPETLGGVPIIQNKFSPILAKQQNAP